MCDREHISYNTFPFNYMYLIGFFFMENTFLLWFSIQLHLNQYSAYFWVASLFFHSFRAQIFNCYNCYNPNWMKIRLAIIHRDENFTIFFNIFFLFSINSQLIIDVWTNDLKENQPNDLKYGLILTALEYFPSTHTNIFCYNCTIWLVCVVEFFDVFF